MTARRQVAVVTGGGGGIGAAIAEELGRNGWFVVTVDPLVTLDGSEKLPEPDETTAGRIVAAGGAASASSLSVTDGAAVRHLFGQLAAEHGALGAVVNVAGITRQIGFAHGAESDWRAVVEVHLAGWLNVLGAALPLMADAGSGHILGVTSGSGWRLQDAGGYSCAKRAVASLTWQLGRQVPPGVTVNAMSPIAATRMVAAAVERARREGKSGASGGMSLFESMPGPEDLAPLGAHFCGDAFGWCNGRVLFAGGPEVAVIDQPRLIEVVRTGDVASLERVLEAIVPRGFAAAESKQASGGGGNPRFGPIFDESAPAAAPDQAPADVRSCVIVTDRPGLGASLTAALSARSVACHRLDTVDRDFAGAARALDGVVASAGPVDAIVVGAAGRAHMSPPTRTDDWARTLADHAGIVEDIHADAAWARTAADYAAAADRPVRLLTLTDARTAGGRSRAQSSAQLARVGGSTTEGRVAAFAVSVEVPEQEAAGPAAALCAHLACHPEAGALAGAELVVGPGWLGIRSHPRPIGSITYGGPAVPDWLDGALAEICGSAGPTGDTVGSTVTPRAPATGAARVAR